MRAKSRKAKRTNHYINVTWASNQRRPYSLLNRSIRCTSKKTSKLCVTGTLCGNPPLIGGFPSQRDSSNMKKNTVSLRHHDKYISYLFDALLCSMIVTSFFLSSARGNICAVCARLASALCFWPYVITCCVLQFFMDLPFIYPYSSGLFWHCACTSPGSG